MLFFLREIRCWLRLSTFSLMLLKRWALFWMYCIVIWISHVTYYGYIFPHQYCTKWTTSAQLKILAFTPIHLHDLDVCNSFTSWLLCYVQVKTDSNRLLKFIACECLKELEMAYPVRKCVWKLHSYISLCNGISLKWTPLVPPLSVWDMEASIIQVLLVCFQ